jgi:hypothetical protein
MFSLLKSTTLFRPSTIYDSCIFSLLNSKSSNEMFNRLCKFEVRFFYFLPRCANAIHIRFHVSDIIIPVAFKSYFFKKIGLHYTIYLCLSFLLTSKPIHYTIKLKSPSAVLFSVPCPISTIISCSLIKV